MDPACGSAAILIGALDRIAYAVAKARSSPQEPRDTDLAHIRREVLQRCIYGVDKDPFAVELAKVALWIHCVVPDEPLTFLDHHIVCGDSLVGWPLLDVPTSIPDAAYDVQNAKGAERAMLTKARRRNEQFIASGGDLYQQGDVAFHPDPSPRSCTPTSTPLPMCAARPPPTGHGRPARSTPSGRGPQTCGRPRSSGPTPTGDLLPLSSTLPRSKAIPTRNWRRPPKDLLSEINPLHWPLAFPEAYAVGRFRPDPRQPPMGTVQGRGAAVLQAAQACYRGDDERDTQESHRGAGESDPPLFARWKTYQALQGRLAHYAKTCGRYTRTSNETNTYVLFTELAARSSSHVGLIVKSGIATDAAQSAVWKRLLHEQRVAAGHRHRSTKNATANGSSLRSPRSNGSASFTSAPPPLRRSRLRC